MSTLYIYAPAYEHTYPQHPENATRAKAVHHLLERENLLPDLYLVEPVAAKETQIRRAHDRQLMERVQMVSFRGGGHMDADTYVTAETYELARLAAGSACLGVDKVVTGEVNNGFVVARPPGHHAEYKSVGGFCFFNNVAIAARQAQRAHGLGRVLILDFDVHHGNGTQDIFYDDPSVLFVSIHQYGRMFYPGTGHSKEIGRGRGMGYTLNAPLPEHVGDVGYIKLFRELILPKIEAFQPQLMLISAGFDAHWADPLAMGALGLRGYAQLAQMLVETAEKMCKGRILFVMEGGYLLDALAYGVLNSVYALLGRDMVKDPLGAHENKEAEIGGLLNALHKIHST